MIAVERLTTKGRKVFAVKLDVEEALGLGLDNQGMCIKCGEFADGVEPDARKYECECCSECAVYGIEELVMMGYCV